MTDRRFILGADVGGSHICSAVIDIIEGKLVSDPHSTPTDSHAGADEIFANWATNLQESLNAFDGEVASIGMALPGPFDYEKGISLMTEEVGKFESLYGLNVGEALSKHKGLENKSFRYVNDAAAFALGECFWGAGKDHDRVLVLTLGTGVGSGFVADRKLLTSGEGVPPMGYVYNIPFEDGIADEAFSTRWFIKRYAQLSGKTVSGAKEIADAVNDDPAASQLFNEYGSRLAKFSLPLLDGFGCKLLLLGGNISRNLPLFASPMADYFAVNGKDITVRAAQMPSEAAIFGGASLFAE